VATTALLPAEGSLGREIHCLIQVEGAHVQGLEVAGGQIFTGLCQQLRGGDSRDVLATLVPVPLHQ
jgi:hypothetical protein